MTTKEKQKLPSNVYDTFDPKNNYDQVVFSANKTLQSRELVELQRISEHRTKGVFDYLLRDGAILKDCTISINADTKEVTCADGELYIDGAKREVKEATFPIAFIGSVTIGVYLREKYISAQEDPSLLNPAIGTRGEGEEGAYRLQRWIEWGVAPTIQNSSDTFYAVYTLDDGELRATETPPQLDSISTALASYDVESTGGSYVVQGLTVLMLQDTENGEQTYTVSEGSARVLGRKVALPVSRRMTKKANPDLLLVESEPYISRTEEKQRITLDRYPVGAVNKVKATIRTTKNITKSGYKGSLDPLPDTSITAITKVEQGGVTFTQDTDYTLTAGKVDWTLGGLEPSPNSTYTVTYEHIVTLTPEEKDSSGFFVTGAVKGTQITTTYTQMLPRLDCLCVTREGEFTWVEGVANEYNPQRPHIPENMLALATVYQTWDEKRRTINDGTLMVPMNKIADMTARMNNITNQLAQIELAADVNTREAGAKKGLFVDPCLNDSMRDQGLEQSAAVLNGVITLPIDITTIARMPTDVTQPETLSFVASVAAEQLAKTGSVNINPHKSFAPFPAFITLTPAVDNWTDVQTTWASSVARKLNTTNDGYYHVVVSKKTTESIETVTSSTELLENLRSIPVAFATNGFGPLEKVNVTFDGIQVTPSRDHADENGVYEGTFTIPEGIPAGTKEVVFTGSGGNAGSALFTGQGELTNQTLRMVNTTVLTWHDPQAETFALDTPCQLIGVDIWGTKNGTSDIVVQLRETTVGMPNETVLAEGIIPQSALLTDGNPTRILFKAPSMQNKNVESAFVVMCTDGESSIAMAEMGEWDTTNNRVITAQPYPIGVNLSSSNNSSWTVYQERDLTFRLLKAKYTEQVRVIDLGDVEVKDVTDLMILGTIEIPTATTRVEFMLTLPESYQEARELTLTNRQPARLSHPVTGKIHVQAKLVGNENFSPVLYPGTQLVCGNVGEDATYITRAVPAGQESKVRVILDAYIPSGASHDVLIQEDGTEEWKKMTFVSSSPQDNNFVESTYEATTDALRVRVKLVATGSTKARPMLANPRVLTL